MQTLDALQGEFEKLQDSQKVAVMQNVVRRVLQHLKTARAPGSDNITFLAFIAGNTFEEVVIHPLETISGWSDAHTESTHRRAERIHEEVAVNLKEELIKSPTAKFRHLKKILLGGSLTAAGIGLAVVGRMIWRAQRRTATSAAHEK